MIQPLADRVVVETNPASEQTTKSGILSPTQPEREKHTRVIVAVGQGRKDELLTVKVGDNVMYPQDGRDKYSDWRQRIFVDARRRNFANYLVETT